EVTSPAEPISVRTLVPDDTDHSLTACSGLLLPDAKSVPSGENASASTLCVCPVKVRTKLRLVAFQILTVWSTLAEAIRSLPGENATAVTAPVCPVKVAATSPVDEDHTFTVWSWLADAAHKPFGEYATLVVAALCPGGFGNAVPPGTLQSRSVE